MRAQRIKIHEIFKVIKNDNTYVMPDKTKHYTKKSLREFLNFSVSAYSAAQVLFSKNDYAYSVIDYPRETAKFANNFLTDSTAKFNIVMPADFPIEEFTSILLQKYFPKEWIIKHFIIDEEKIVVKYDETKKEFYLENFKDDKLFLTCSSINASTVKKAVNLGRVGEIYTLYLNKDA